MSLRWINGFPGTFLRAGLVVILLAALAAPAAAWVPPLADTRAPDFSSGGWPEPRFRMPENRGFQLYDLPEPDKTPPAPDLSAPAPDQAPAAQTPAPPVQGPDKDKWIIDVQGYRYLRLRNFGSSGNSSRFESSQGLFNYGATIEQGTDLTMAAASGDRYSLTGSFYEMPNQDRAMEFNLGAGNYSLNFGDITLSFQGGSFTPFSKKITGFELGYETTRMFAQFFTSESKSQTLTETFTGRNIKGPYDLSANDLIPDKVTVKLNQTVLGSGEYILDAFLGEITFYEILQPSDVVTVTYEQRLRGSLNAGNLMGLAAKFDGGRYRVGYSYLLQQANRESQAVEKTVTGETASLDPATGLLTVDHPFIVRTLDSGSETIRKVASDGLTTTLEPDIDYNAVSREEKMSLYARGQFLLKEPFDANATYDVSYAYYPSNVVQQQINEYISHIGGVYTLQQQTIYYGAEVVRLCNDVSCTSFDPTEVVRGRDYIVEESQNRLVLYNYQDRDLSIDYWYYPLGGDVQSTQFDHTVNDVSVEYDVSEAIKLKTEFARSEADVSAKPIQQLNEIVTVTGQALSCSSTAVDAVCRFPLAHNNLVDNSTTIYFNDRVTQENILTAFMDYFVDTAQGVVEIRRDIPAGTAIIADYRYLPNRAGGLETGNIWQMDGAFRNDSTQFALSLKGADTFFTPVGGEANLETARTNWSLQHKFSPNLQFGVKGLTVGSATDLEHTHTTTQKQNSFDVNWNLPGQGMKINAAYATRNQSDDFSPHQTDSSEKAMKFDVGAPVPMLKNATFTLGFTSQSVDAFTAGAASTENTRRRLGLSWKPSQKLSLSGDFSDSSLSSDSAAAAFTSNTNARSLNATWMPVDLITLGAKVDTQTKTDSRPDTEGSVINNTMIRLDARPFWRVKYFGFVLTKNDRPSIKTPSSSTNSKSWNTSFAITRAISFTPSWNTSRSVFGGTSVNQSDNTIYKLEYRPPGRPYHLDYSLETGERSNSSPTAQSRFDTSRRKIEFGYDPSPVWAFSTTLQHEQEDADNAIQNRTQDKLGMQLRYKPRTGRSHWLLYNHNKFGGAQDYTRGTLELGLDYRLTEMFSWDLMYRIEDYSDGSRSELSYNGYLLESSLRIEF